MWVIIVSELVFIILVNWNNHIDTIECLNSLQSLKNIYYKIILVDNNSKKESLLNILNYLKRTETKFSLLNVDESIKCDISEDEIIVLKNSRNSGFAGGNNIGIKFAIENNASYIWLLNNDTVVESNTLYEMIRYARQYDAGIIGSKILYYYNKKLIQNIGGWLNFKTFILGNGFGNNAIDDGQYDKAIEPDYINGASMLIKRDVLEKNGLFDEKYFLYWEETDYCIRAKKRGFKMLYCPLARVYHKDGATTKKVNKLSLYYYTRNALYFYKKNYKQYFYAIYYLGYIYKILKRLLRLDFQSIKYINKAYKDYNKSIMGKMV